MQTDDGNLYGTTYAGGPSNLGTIFRLTPDGTFAMIGWFNGSNGANPESGLIQGSDGDLYGTTLVGGTAGYGTVFKIATNGTFVSLASFNNSNGARPQGAMVQGLDGNFYGTTSLGGTAHYSYGQAGLGTVFQITTNGVLTDLLAFNLYNGAQPGEGLMLAKDGNLYGTTVGVNQQWGGEVFRLTNAVPPVFQSVSQTADQITFTWSAIPGQAYEIDYSTDLKNWQNLFGGAFSMPFATGTNSDFITPGSQRFYRVVLLP